MLVALILVSIGFAVTLGMLLFGSNRAAIPACPSHVKGELEDPSKARARSSRSWPASRRSSTSSAPSSRR